MEPMISVAFWGLVGALAAEVVVWRKLVDSDKLPYTDKFGEKRYIAQAIACILLGPLLNIAHLESGNVMLPWLALHIGATSPIIVGALTGRMPNVME